jgi:hypothetical protein
MVFFMVVSIIHAKKHTLFKSRLLKVFRLSQEASFALILSLIVKLYFSDNSGPALIISFLFLLGLNILLELILLVKDLSRAFCKKKSKKPNLNKLEPLELQEHDELVVGSNKSLL